MSADEVITRLRPKLAQVPGATLYLQAVQDVRLGGRISNAQYQFTLQSDNLDQALRDRGLETSDKPLKIYDAGFSVGGPIAKNKLWFIGAPRTWGTARGGLAAASFPPAKVGRQPVAPVAGRPDKRSLRTWHTPTRNTLDSGLGLGE